MTNLPPPPSAVPPPQVYVAQPIQRKTNGMAIASLVLSIVWIAGFGSILAIIFGFVSKKRIERSNGSQTGSGLAIAGIIIGFVELIPTVLFWVGIMAVGTGVGVITYGAASYADGSNYATHHYSVGATEASVCSRSNVPGGDSPTLWISGCQDGWSIASVGATGSTGITGNTGVSGVTG